MSAYTTVITPELLAEIDAKPVALFSHASPASQLLMQPLLGGNFPISESLTYGLMEISIQRQVKAISDADATTILVAALTDTGYLAPDGLSKMDLLWLLDYITETRDYDKRDNRCLFATAVALKLGDLDTAHTYLDGPDGAGIGWDLNRQELQRSLGLTITHEGDNQ